jgi:hypothetical protein
MKKHLATLALALLLAVIPLSAAACGSADSSQTDSSEAKEAASPSPSASPAATPAPEPESKATESETPAPDLPADPPDSEALGPDLPIAPDAEGNTAGNMANGGMIVVSGDWVYCSDKYKYVGHETGIYKTRTGGGDNTLLTIGEGARNLSVLGNWIYFIKEDSVQGGFKQDFLFRIRIDGTEETKLFEESVSDFYVVGDWIYFNSKEFNNNGLHKMKTDGTEATRLVGDNAANRSDVYNITVIGDWVYYCRGAAGVQFGDLYKIKVDGTEQTEMKRRITQFVIVGDWIYYSPQGILSDIGIYKMLTDGTEDTKIIGECLVFYLNTDGEWLYFYEQAKDPGNDFMVIYSYDELYGRLHKLSLDGAEDIVLSEDETWSYNINIVGDWIYFYVTDFLDVSGMANGFYKIKTDGTEKQRV